MLPRPARVLSPPRVVLSPCRPRLTLTRATALEQLSIGAPVVLLMVCSVRRLLAPRRLTVLLHAPPVLPVVARNLLSPPLHVRVRLSCNSAPALPILPPVLSMVLVPPSIALSQLLPVWVIVRPWLSPPPVLVESSVLPRSRSTLTLLETARTPLPRSLTLSIVSTRFPPMPRFPCIPIPVIRTLVGVHIVRLSSPLTALLLAIPRLTPCVRGRLMYIRVMAKDVVEWETIANKSTTFSNMTNTPVGPFTHPSSCTPHPATIYLTSPSSLSQRSALDIVVLH